VGVAPEGEAGAPGVVPPPHDLGGEGEARVQLERPARSGQRAEHGPQLVLEVVRVEGRGVRRPPPGGVVDVGQHLELLGRLDHAQHLRQVRTDELARRDAAVQLVDEPLATLEGQRVHRPEHPVEAAVRGQGPQPVAEAVRLPDLRPGPYVEPREPLPAPGHAVEVAVHVEGRR
jgi:hypothetical protein